MSGIVQTVTGPIAPEELGVTMSHEHLLLLNPSFVEPIEASERHRAHEPVSEQNIEWVRQYWTSNVDNLQLYDEPGQSQTSSSRNRCRVKFSRPATNAAVVVAKLRA